MGRLQWVNLPPADDGSIKQATFSGGDVSGVDVMGRDVFIEAQFDDKEAASLAILEVKPDGDNATYDAAEASVAADVKPKASVTEKGVARFGIKVATAGGDKYNLVIKDKAGAEKKTDEVETRRQLYYQVIKMKGMTATEATLTSHLESEFWNTGKKHYIKMVKVASRGEMDAVSNFDEHQQSKIPALAKAQYNGEKDPYCFALVLVDQLAASDKEVVSKASVRKAEGKVELNARNWLWLDLDGAAAPEAKWVLEATFAEDSGSTIDLAAHVTAVGSAPTKKLAVDLSSLADGAKGTVTVKVKVVDRFRTGLSLGSNFICVATRATWAQRDSEQMKSTLVHEAGHKVDMVPAGGGPGGLKRQSTYYELRGGHCNHATDKCVMYGVIHGGRSNEFCDVCKVSVRRLNLDARKLPGFQPP